MFVEGLYKILDDGNYKSLISWSYDGKTFFIWDKELFTNHVLKEFTAQNHFASFERQLNMYNFGRISDGRSTRKSEEYEPVEFGHDYFQRGRKDLLKLIKRRPRLASDRASCKKSTTIGRVSQVRPVYR
ncbi:HSF-type DNA-binding-domain-containing protein [Syncephalis plumigaleata]|nr:HSF-type DNA-binding-domain-containing protein [Syncephalis plumigaleata]